MNARRAAATVAYALMHWTLAEYRKLRRSPFRGPDLILLTQTSNRRQTSKSLTSYTPPLEISEIVAKNEKGKCLAFSLIVAKIVVGCRF
jgi:hypothetical protein